MVAGSDLVRRSVTEVGAGAGKRFIGWIIKFEYSLKNEMSDYKSRLVMVE